MTQVNIAPAAGTTRGAARLGAGEPAADAATAAHRLLVSEVVAIDVPFARPKHQFPALEPDPGRVYALLRHGLLTQSL